ncbi:MAG: site-specific DNA-methyltransferase [Myxococcales bacterium]|nr:site-specific DNA-methyltransferase [Myxococcales bacterium]
MSSRPAKPNSKALGAKSPQPQKGGKQRRSQATTRRSVGIKAGGIKTLREPLTYALRGAKDDELVKNSLTHPLHSYPARMHPATARALVDICFGIEKVQPRVVLDPFCGSGTTLVEGRAAGLDVIGADLNPLAVRIARAKTWACPKKRLTAFEQLGAKISAAAVEEGKAARRADYEPRPIRILKGVDPAARDEEIAPWYAPHVRRELEFIAGAIDEEREEDEQMADLLSVCLSSLLIKTSRRTSDTSPKGMKRNIARGAPGRWFGERIELMVQGLIDLHREGASGDVTLLERDARKLVGPGVVAPESVGAIISSPPYIGTYDYVDHHRLRLAFLGMPYDDFERKEIGARRRFKGRAHQAALKAIDDFKECLKGFDEVLVPGGLMALMVGDSVAGVEPVWADGVLREIAEDRFSVLGWVSQERDKLGSLEKRAFGEYPKREHILLFEKKSQS